MIRVAQFASVVVESWNGPAIDKTFIIQCALVHDLGNIVVFRNWFGDEQNDLVRWQQVQAEVVARYGTNDHEVTRQMLEAAKVDSKIIAVVLAKSSANSPKIAASDDWALKILLYSDLRISPTGVVSLKDRLQEMYARSDKHKNLTGIPEALDDVERQLQAHSSRELTAITEADFILDTPTLLATNI